ncbi:MFP2b [Aphelenchoides fujianensis]|nr:MFP2b [Aphelenchoides fujianensis]
MPNPPPKEDTWAFQLIGTAFPENPVKCFGQQNILWYKHGKPIHGRAWNNGGVVECSFPYALSKLELTERRDLGGQIQVLQYKGDHLSLGYWRVLPVYNWIPYKQRPDPNNQTTRQLVRCGESIPILWTDRKEGALLGYVDSATETAHFGAGGKCISIKGEELNNMLIIVRELVGGPPTCECHECKQQPPKPGPRVMLNEWADFRAGDPFPPSKCVRALFRPLNTLPGEPADQYVGLWYQQGEPVMGRIWNEGGKIAACFSWGGHEYRNNIGSLQVLFELPEHVRGFDYDWKPFSEAAQFGAKEWFPVHVDNYKGDISPGVLLIDGKEILGKVDVRNERATAGHKGEEKVLVGPAVHSCKVLCRKARPGCKFD